MPVHVRSGRYGALPVVLRDGKNIRIFATEMVEQPAAIARERERMAARRKPCASTRPRSRCNGRRRRGWSSRLAYRGCDAAGAPSTEAETKHGVSFRQPERMAKRRPLRRTLRACGVLRVATQPELLAWEGATQQPPSPPPPQPSAASATAHGQCFAYQLHYRSLSQSVTLNQRVNTCKRILSSPAMAALV